MIIIHMKYWAKPKVLHSELDKLLKTMPEGSRQVVEQVRVVDDHIRLCEWWFDRLSGEWLYLSLWVVIFYGLSPYKEDTTFNILILIRILTLILILIRILILILMLRTLTGSKTFLASSSTQRARAWNGTRLKSCRRNRWEAVLTLKDQMMINLILIINLMIFIIPRLSRTATCHVQKAKRRWKHFLTNL